MGRYRQSAWVSGDPKGQPRARASTFYSTAKNKYMARMFDPGTAENWKGQVQLAFADKLPPVPLDGPIRLEITFVFRRPKKLYRRKDPDGRLWHTKKPDVDNALKAIMDALTNIEMWRDDTQVAEIVITKHIGQKNERGGAQITVEQLAAQEVATEEAIAV